MGDSVRLPAGWALTGEKRANPYGYKKEEINEENTTHARNGKIEKDLHIL